MARRSDHSPEELKNLMIRAGLKLIHKDGFHSFSARKVASEVGYTVGSVYHVFGSYDGLILHINVAILDYMHEEIKGALEGVRQKDALVALAEAYIDFAQTHYPAWLALFEYRLDENTELPEWYQERLEALFMLIEEQLLPYTGNDRRKARREAKILWAGIHGIAVLGLSGKLDVVGADSMGVLIKSFIHHYTLGMKTAY